MACYQLIITIKISNQSKSFIWRRAYYSHFKYHNKNMENSVKRLLSSFQISQPQFYSVVTIVIVINVVIGGFSGEDLKWLAHITVQLQVSNYSQLSDYTVQLQLCRLIRNSNWTKWSTIQGVIARVISKSDEREARGRFEITSTITPWIVRHEVQLLINCICNKFRY